MTQTTVFREVIGTCPETKVIEYFCEWNGVDLTITDLARDCSIGRNQAYRVVKGLVKKNIVIKTRKLGRMQFYGFNKDDEISKLFDKLFRQILKNNL